MNAYYASEKDMDRLWQTARDEADFAFRSAQNEKQRERLKDCDEERKHDKILMQDLVFEKKRNLELNKLLKSLQKRLKLLKNLNLRIGLIISV